MATFAFLAPDPASLLGWVVVGLVPGFLAARVYRGGRLGPGGDVAVGAAGVVGAVAGGTLAGGFGPAPGAVMPLMAGYVAAALAAIAVVLPLRWLGPQPRLVP